MPCCSPPPPTVRPDRVLDEWAPSAPSFDARGGATPDDWSAPEKLFEGPYFFVEGPRMFDVASDGRFLMLKAEGGDADPGSPASLIVVQNWPRN